jgi:hypothetical protein
MSYIAPVNDPKNKVTYKIMLCSLLFYMGVNLVTRSRSTQIGAER